MQRPACFSKRAANRSYAYGYGRAEVLAGVAIVGVIFSACVAGYQSVVKLIKGSGVSHVGWVAAAAVVGFVGNEVVARFLGIDGRHRYIGRRNGLSVAVDQRFVGVLVQHAVEDYLAVFLDRLVSDPLGAVRAHVRGLRAHAHLGAGRPQISA